MEDSATTSVQLTKRCSEISRGYNEDLRGTAGQSPVWRFHPHGLPWPKDVPKTNGVKEVWYRPSQDGDISQLPTLLWNSATGLLANNNSTVESFIGVCSHARHDLCCGERGKKVLRRIQRFDDSGPVYSCSHLGGDRFAANMIILPEGLLLGRTDELDDDQLQQILKRNTLPAHTIRGRIGVTPVLSATEIWYRQQRLITSFVIETTFTVQESDSNNHWRVEINEPNNETTIVEATLRPSGPVAHLTCGAQKTSSLQNWEFRQA